MPALSQNFPTKLIVWIVGGQSTVPQFRFLLLIMIDKYLATIQANESKNPTIFNIIRWPAGSLGQKTHQPSSI
jgi:hypothetical protein